MKKLLGVLLFGIMLSVSSAMALSIDPEPIVTMESDTTDLGTEMLKIFMSENDINQYVHYKNKIGAVNAMTIKNMSEKFAYGKMGDDLANLMDATNAVQKVITRVDDALMSLTMKYPADVAMSNKDTTLHYVLYVLKVELMIIEHNFQTM